MILDRIPGDIHVAAMHIGGWYDVFTEGTIAGYRAYSDRGDDWARKNQYMVIGPWDHWSLAQSLGQEESFGYAMQSDMLAWVSYCLAGDDSMVSRWPHVRYYVMGSTEDGAPGNEWRSSPDWPLPTEYKSFPITAGGILADPDRETPVGDDVIGDVEANAGVDSRSLPEGGSVLPRALPFDHASTSPVVGGRNLVGSSGRMELSKVLARKDYVLFETEPLLEPFESIGRMSARLDVSTRWPDADVIVRLADVYPDGSTWIVSDGAIRLSRRNGCESAVEVQADTTYAVDVDLLTSAMVFNTGHRIALIVTSTLYAKYELNPALEAESRANGPIADAFVVHGGELLMPIASPIVDIPDSVEQAEVVEQSADALVGDLTVVADAAIDAPDSDAVEQADIAEPSTDLGADIAIDAAAGADNGDSGSGADMSNFDARDVPSIDLATRDVVDADGESHDDGGPSEEAGGCSSMGRGQQKGVPTAFLLLLLGLFGLRLRRFNR